MICGLRCGGKLRKPFRLVRQLQLSTGICVRLSGVLRILRSDGDLFRRRGILFAFGILPGLYVRSLFNFRSIRLCSCFPRRSSFVCGAAAPPALSCAASPLLSVSEAPLDMLKVSPSKHCFPVPALCAFPFCSCFRVLRCLEEGCTPSACWISSCGVFFLEAAADACTFPCSAFFAALPFFFACLLDATCSFFPADQSIKPGARETRSPGA